MGGWLRSPQTTNFHPSFKIAGCTLCPNYAPFFALILLVFRVFLSRPKCMFASEHELRMSRMTAHTSWENTRSFVPGMPCALSRGVSREMTRVRMRENTSKGCKIGLRVFCQQQNLWSDKNRKGQGIKSIENTLTLDVSCSQPICLIFYPFLSK